MAAAIVNALPQVSGGFTPSSGTLSIGQTASLDFAFQCLNGNGNCAEHDGDGKAIVYVWAPSTNVGTISGVSTNYDEGSGYWHTTATYNPPTNSTYSAGSITWSFKVCEHANGTVCNENQTGNPGFAVDTLRPSVSSPTLSNYYLLNGQSTTVYFNFSEGVTGFDASDVTVQSGTLSGFTADSTSQYHATFTAGNYNQTGNTISIGTGWTDIAGNSPTSGGSSSAYTVWAAPQLQTAIYNANETNNTYTLNFDEIMTAGATDLSKIYIGSVVMTGALKGGSGATITITPTEAQRAAIKALSSRTVTLSAGAVQDWAGNNNQSYSGSILSFTQDTTKPTITTLSVNDRNLAEADVGSGKFVVTTVFDETMNTSITPGIEFIPEVSSTLSCDGVWTDAFTFTYTCDVFDANVTISNINIRVTGAQDITTNNVMLPDTRNSQFSIDTDKPVLSSLSVNKPWIGEGSVGSGTFVVTAVFEESMDTATVPGIAFIPQQSSTLSCSGIWANSTTFNYNCDVTDADVEQLSVGIKVTNAKDLAGNKMDPNTQTNAFGIDTVKPTISITDNASGTWTNSDTITASPNDGTGSGIKVTKWLVRSNSTCDSSLNSTFDSSGNSGASVTANSDSNYFDKYICFRTTDNADNNQYVASSQIAHLDTTAPNTTGAIAGGTLGSNGWYKTNVTYTLSTADTAGQATYSGVAHTYYCTDTNGSCTPSTSGTSITLSTESATNHVRYYSDDNATNTQTTQTSSAIKIDKTAPTTTGKITGGTLGDNNWYTTNVTYTITPRDDTSGIADTNYCVDTNNTCTPTIPYSSAITLSTESATNYVRFRSMDNAGWVQDFNSSGAIKIDKTKPTTTGGKAGTLGSNGWYVSDVNYTITPADATSTPSSTAYCVDTENTCTPDTNYTGIITISNESATNYVRFATTDYAGWVQDFNSSGAIKIDKTKPTTTLTQENGTTTWNNFDVNFTLSCVDQEGLSDCNSTSPKYSIDNGAWTTYTSTVTLSTDGNHKIDYNSTDNAGNTESTNTFYIAVDKTAPTTTFTQVNGTSGWNNTNVDFNLACHDTNSGCATIYYRLNTDESSVYSSAIKLVNDGNTAITYYSVDNAGNDENAVTKYIAIDNNVVTINDHNATQDLNMYYPVQCKYDTNSSKTFADMNSSVFPSSGPANELTVIIGQLDANTSYNYTILCQDENENKYTIPFNFTTQVDTTSPTVTMGTVAVTTSTATIPVTTNEPAKCRYLLGTDSNYDAMSTTTDTNLGWSTLTTNMPQITGLNANTTYTAVIACRDDYNNDANESISFTTNSEQQSSVSSWGGTTAYTAAGTQTILTTTETFTPTPEEISTALEDSGLSAQDIAAYTEAARTGGLELERTLVVNSTTANGSTIYTSTFSIIITNNSRNNLNNIYVVETIPKNVASSASQITSIYQFRVLKADPVLEFAIPALKSGETAKVTYTVNKNTSGTDFNSMKPPVAKFSKSQPNTPSNPTTNTGTDSNTQLLTPNTGVTGNEAPVGTADTTPWGLVLAGIVIIIFVVIGYVKISSKKESKFRK